MAIRYNNIDLVKALIELGANVNQPSPGDGNPLIMATKTASIPMLKILLAAGAKINNAVDGDETPLINASFQSDLPLVQYLISEGADVNLAVEASIYDGNELRSPLNSARTQEIRDYLLSQGALQ
jgi:ankyrin repeat protein